MDTELLFLNPDMAVAVADAPGAVEVLGLWGVDLLFVGDFAAEVVGMAVKGISVVVGCSGLLFRREERFCLRWCKLSIRLEDGRPRVAGLHSSTLMCCGDGRGATYGTSLSHRCFICWRHIYTLSIFYPFKKARTNLACRWL
jgi:hypothetical protein